MKKIVKVVLFVYVSILLVACAKKPDIEMYLASENKEVLVINEETNEEVSFVRGQMVYQLGKQKDVPEGKKKVYILDENNEKIYYLVEDTMLVENKEEVCQEKVITSNMLVNLRTERLGTLSDQIALKGQELEIDHIDYENDFNEEDGSVNGYYIKVDENIYYLPSTFYQEETMDKNQIFYGTYFDRFYGAGYSRKNYIDDITYLSLDKPNFESNPLQTDAHAIHVSMDVFFNEEAYILNICDTTPIDTVVIEMKNDDGRFIFESENVKAYLDEAHQQNAFKVALSKETFSKRIETMKEHGIYVIGRMVTFKDPNFVSQYPEAAITYPDGRLFIHDALPWPSAYNRKCWQYIVDYCKEAVTLGINEIQFDYVRFPDGLSNVNVDLKNQYNESKIQAIQGFLFYAREQIHALNAYIAADVFGWNMICGDDENIGQFIPAIATVVDVICPMSYPDHFDRGAFGIQYPWQQPGLLQTAFTTKSMEVLKTIEKPALYRSWIQGYDAMGYKCTGEAGNGPRPYLANEMIQQIQGIRNGGATGYIVWSIGGRAKWEDKKAGFIE